MVSTISGKFLPFKTPLDERYDSMVPEANRFNIQMLMTSMKTYKVNHKHYDHYENLPKQYKEFF